MHVRLMHIGIVAFLSSIFVLSSLCHESLFPEINGYKLAQEDQVYNASNLWDIIDGAADLYLEYMFVDLHIARYTSADSLEVKAELYRHSSDVNAYGIYSQERDPYYRFIQIGVQGYLQQGVLNFLAGVYYIKLSTFKMDTAGQEALLTIGRALDDHLKQERSWPSILRFFPTSKKLPNTDQYIARNFLGYSFMNSAFVVTYEDSTSFKAFIIATASPEQAEAMKNEYLNKVPKETIKKLDETQYEIQDAYNGPIGIAVQKNFLLGVVNCTDTQKRAVLIEGLRANLSQR